MQYVAMRLASIEVLRVPKVDPFCKSRVSNFIKRLPSLSTVANCSIEKLVQTEEIVTEGAVGGTTPQATQFVVRLKIPFADPVGERCACGIASNGKDAEALAFMHAERIVDALGLHLYAMKTMQNQHAKECRAFGRWAPTSDDPPRTAAALPPALMLAPGGADAANVATVSFTEKPSKSTFTPNTTAAAAPPRAGYEARPVAQRLELRELSNVLNDIDAESSTKKRFSRRIKMLRHQRADGALKSADESEGGAWFLVVVVTSRIPLEPHTILTPCSIDTNCVGRVEDYFAFHGIVFNSAAVVTTGDYGTDTFFTASIVMPFKKPGTNEDVVAKGKSISRETAQQLLAMHCELLCDFYGKELFPGDDRQKKTQQKLHERSLQLFGRQFGAWNGGSLQEPLPMKELNPTMNDFFYQSRRTAPLSDEERYVSSHREGGNSCTISLDSSGVEEGECMIPGFESEEEARAALRALNRRFGGREEFFLPACSHAVHVTTVLPLPVEQYGIRVGAATGPNVKRCVHMCTGHSLEILNALDINVFENAERQKEYAAKRSALGLCVPSPLTVDNDQMFLSSHGMTSFKDYKKIPSPPCWNHVNRRPKILPSDAAVQRALSLEYGKDLVGIGDSVLPLGALIQHFVSGYQQKYKFAHFPNEVYTARGMYGRQISLRWEYIPLPQPEELSGTSSLPSLPPLACAVGCTTSQGWTSRYAILHAMRILMFYKVTVFANEKEHTEWTQKICEALMIPPLRYKDCINAGKALIPSESANELRRRMMLDATAFDVLKACPGYCRDTLCRYSNDPKRNRFRASAGLDKSDSDSDLT